jgi:hypothetical protein
MSTTTPADQQTLEDLSTAMMLLEMHGKSMFSEPDQDCYLKWAAQSIIQNIAARMQGWPATQLEMISETLEMFWEKVALDIATGTQISK